MRAQIIERLAKKLAKLNGWEWGEMNSENPIQQDYLKMAEYGLKEIHCFLKEEEIEFDDLELDENYQFPCAE